MTKKIALFGGTFDPPHAGHRDLVLEAMEAFGLDEVFVYPDITPGYKTDRLPLHHRQTMIDILFANDAHIHTHPPKEIATQAGDGQMWELYAQVQSHFKHDQVYFILGTDVFLWYRDAVCSKTDMPPMDMIVGQRGAVVPLQDTLNGGAVLQFEQKDKGISSSAIRRDLLSGNVPAHLPPDVYGYIKRHGLYGVPPKKYPRMGMTP